MIDFHTAPFLPIADRLALPDVSCVYAAISQDKILYIGATMNLRRRWASHTKLTSLQGYSGVRIHYIEAPIEDLANLEIDLIARFEPVLNGKAGRYSGVARLAAELGAETRRQMVKDMLMDAAPNVGCSPTDIQEQFEQLGYAIGYRQVCRDLVDINAKRLERGRYTYTPTLTEWLFARQVLIRECERGLLDEQELDAIVTHWRWVAAQSPIKYLAVPKKTTGFDVAIFRSIDQRFDVYLSCSSNSYDPNSDHYIVDFALSAEVAISIAQDAAVVERYGFLSQAVVEHSPNNPIIAMRPMRPHGKEWRGVMK